MLGLSERDPSLAHSMMTTAETLVGYEVVAVFGVAEGTAEGSFPAVGVAGIGVAAGGGLDQLVADAKAALARAAAELGANAVLSLRYEVIGRPVEKSVLAYGTAVKCRKLTV